jgi:Fic family protein
MSQVSKRKIKGKTYYYFEKKVRIGKKIKNFQEYLGSTRPAKKELLKLEKKLNLKINNFYKKELLKPKTEFVDVKTAKSIERIKQETKIFIDGLSAKQKKDWIEQEREKFITNTNAIEGSTLTLDETHRILKLNERLGDDRERLEVLNMEKCLNYYDKMLEKKRELSEELILELHFILLNKIPDYDKYKGIYRPVDVYIKTSKFDFPRYLFVSSLMKRLVGWYHANKNELHGVELAAKFHTKFTTIHPFADGNGRIARLLMNYILQQQNYPFTNIPVRKRNPYFDTQEKGHIQNYKEFTLFLAEQIKENYKEVKRRKAKN